MKKKWDGKEIAELIGADLRVVWEEGDNFFIVKIHKNEKWISRKVCELSEGEANKLKSQGQAGGMNFGHCLYLASKYWKEFKTQVCGYRIVATTDERFSISVEFYSKV